ncbi:MAG TPA: hypothetical protein VJ875_14285 [Pyrinomonadaceae bacterium]|nr:hypothetical protein [Pyrinomonadaceae bacterium]
MKIYRVVTVLSMFLALALAGVQAQAPSKVEVNIPFEFSAGNTTFKPGVYSIKRGSGNLLTLRNNNDKSTVLLNAPLTLSSQDTKAGERLVFNKVGDQYFLAQIWLTADTGRQLIVDKKAKNAERIEISLSTFAR